VVDVACKGILLVRLGLTVPGFGHITTASPATQAAPEMERKGPEGRLFHWILDRKNRSWFMQPMAPPGADKLGSALRPHRLHIGKAV
jgi:hypothetical protein